MTTNVLTKEHISSVDDISHHTPMMQQYLTIKNQYKNMLLLYRMGDFYELFFEDAVLAAKLLGITLTTRGTSGNNPIKMAGVPFHALDQYLSKLVRLGQSVVIVDQVGPVTGRAPVERKVTRIVTPGTLTDSNLLEDKQDNLLVAIIEHKNNIGLAVLSLSSSKFQINEFPESELKNHLNRLNPAEIVIPESLYNYIYSNYKDIYALTKIPDWNFEFDSTHKILCEHFSILNLDGFGITPYKLGITAAGALIKYAKETQCNQLNYISNVSLENTNQALIIDAITRINLEINHTIRGEQSPTLFSSLDECATPMGSRMLRYWLNNPLNNQEKINLRLNAVASLSEYAKFNAVLKQFPDIERITARIAIKNAKPRDLSTLNIALKLLPEISAQLSSNQDKLIQELKNTLNDFPSAVAAKIMQTILPEPSPNIRDGGVINDGYNQELDYLRNINKNGSQYLLELEAKERTRLDIPNLKIEYNRIHGYYIEVSKSHLAKVPEEYIRLGSLKNAERYTLPELKKYTHEVVSALDKAISLEKTLFDEVLEYLGGFIEDLKHLAASISTLDVLGNFADLAKKNNYVKPNLVQEQCLIIEDGRHLVIEQNVDNFIANSIDLTQQRFLLITGPNMGGKSTYMRQTAVITLLAHIGSFVPATNVTIGPIDRIFTRIGAADDLAQGKSTFMVEMIETANILNNATSNSLVLLDEVGRGTSTFDGLALAHAISQYLIEKINPYTLFATHYFELTKLSATYPIVKNVHLSAVEHQDKIIFLHHVNDGALDKSYGIQVASIAGIPKSVIQLANKYLNILGKEQKKELDLFTQELDFAPEVAPNHEDIHFVTNKYQDFMLRIKNLDPNNLNARQALDLIYDLQEKANTLYSCIENS